MVNTAAAPEVTARSRAMTAEERKVILASSLGTVFEWYDFTSMARWRLLLAPSSSANIPKRHATYSRF